MYGCKFTSRKPNYTDKWVFFPAAGQRDRTGLNDAGAVGYYWSSSLGLTYSFEACDILFDSDYVACLFFQPRYIGHSVRPVFPFNGISDIDYEEGGKE